MSARKKVLVVLAALAAPAAAYLLLPDPEERLAMLIRDGHHQEAAVQLQALYDQGERRPVMLASLARLQEASGQSRLAAVTMEAYVAQRPADTGALAALADMHRHADNVEGVTRALARLLESRPDRAVLLRLAALYRLSGRMDAEREMLWAMRDKDVLEAADFERLGGLLLADGQRDRAIDVLPRAVALLPAKAESARLLLFELLLEAGHVGPAMERAVAWAEAWNKPWLTVRLLTRAAREVPARELTPLAAAALRLHPDIRFYLAKTLADEGRGSVAAVLIADWADGAAGATLDELEGYLAAASAIQDHGAIWRDFARVRAAGARPELVGRFAEFVAGRFGLDAVLAMTPAIGRDALGSRPLFAARLALHRQDLPAARAYLLAAPLQRLSPAERSEWLLLVDATGCQSEALRALARMRADDALPPDLRVPFLRLAERLGRPRELLLAANALRQRVTNN